MMDAVRRPSRLRPGESALLGILGSDLFGALGAETIQLTMVFWILERDPSNAVFTLMVLAIFVPLNLGVLSSGVAVERFGARRVLLLSKTLALAGALGCFLLLLAGAMELWCLALLAALIYAALGPSVSADVSRAPAITRLARRQLPAFAAANGIVLTLGRVGGIALAGQFAQRASVHAVAVAWGVGFVAISILCTWVTFPRDRVSAAPSPASTRTRWLALTRRVLERLDGRQIGVAAILLTASSIAVAEGLSEVVAPLAHKGVGLPPSALSTAYVIAVVASVAASLAAPFVHGAVSLRKALAVVCSTSALTLVVAVAAGGWFWTVIGVAVSAAAASALAILTVSTLQLALPVSLQAQAISLWQSLVLLTSALLILLIGLLGSWAFFFLVAIAGLSAGAALLDREGERRIGLRRQLRKSSDG